VASTPLARNQGATGTAEQVRDDIAGFATVEQSTLNQFDRLRGRMDPVSLGLLFFPKGGLGFVPVPGILLADNVAVKQWLVPEFVPTETPSKCVLRPYYLTPDFEPRHFQRILKLPLPRRRVADI
jgi:hypothetical protein